MRLGKPVFAEALYLVVDMQGEVFRVSSSRPACNPFVTERFQPALPFPGRHGTTQLISLTTTEARRDNRKLHHLLLKDRHAEGALEHLLESLFIGHTSRVATTLQIGMHHVALYRSRSHNRNL